MTEDFVTMYKIYQESTNLYSMESEYVLFLAYINKKNQRAPSLHSSVKLLSINKQ